MCVADRSGCRGRTCGGSPDRRGSGDHNRSCVETWAGQRDITGLWMARLAPAHLWSQGFNQPARTQDAREGVIALGTVEFEAEFAGQVNPHRDFLLFPWRGIGFGQSLDDLPPDEVTEQVGFGTFGDVLQVIDVAMAQSVQHEGPVVLKADEVHYFLRRRAAGWGGGSWRAVSRRSTWATILWCSLTSAARARRKRR